MSREIKYIGMDVHKEATVIVVLNSSGKLVMESIVETKASSLVQFIHGLRGELHVTWEEGTWAAWLYDLLQPQVTRVLVCDPRRHALLKEGHKSDKIDARKLADLLRTGMLRPVYHGEHGLGNMGWIHLGEYQPWLPLIGLEYGFPLGIIIGVIVAVKKVPTPNSPGS